jgi:integrase
MKVDIHSGTFFNKAIPLLDKYAMLSFENHKLERRATTTHDYINIYKRHIKPYFGNKLLSDIRVTDINEWKNMLYEKYGLSSKRVNEIKKIFSTILTDAVQDEIIEHNPIKKSKPLPTHQSKEVEPFSIDEIEAILKNCSGQEKHIISYLFFTGVRTGECIGLKWSDISFEQRTIHIQRTIGRGIEGPPKTKQSIRHIDITDRLMKVLIDQYKITGHKNSYVFLNQKGNHYFDSSKLRDYMWKRVLKKAGVRYRPIYQTRHSFCSLHIQAGEDILWISKTIGHSTPKTTLEKYSRYIPREQKRSSIFDNL